MLIAILDLTSHMEINLEIFTTFNLLLPLIQEGLLSVTSESYAQSSGLRL